MNESERRTSLRKRVIQSGTILTPDGNSVFNCIVRNRNADGASLEIPNTIGLPATFKLAIGTEQPRACRVVWRRLNRIGVQFDAG